MISLQHVTKRFDQRSTPAVDSISLDVEEGQTLVLLGSSGCGKTTTLKMINRLIEPSSGTILLDGSDVLQQDILSLRRSIGYVFQDIGLFPHMTSAANVEIVPKLLGWSKSKRRTRSRELLQLVGLEADEHAERMPSQLSGGQQQRIGIARALAADPKYLLMDEPFGALDAVTRDQLQSELVSIRERLGKTIIFVTHDLFEALRLGDHIAVMQAGQIEQIGTPDQLLNEPATPFVADLFQQARRQAETLDTSSSSEDDDAAA